MSSILFRYRCSTHGTFNKSYSTVTEAEGSEDFAECPQCDRENDAQGLNFAPRIRGWWL